jgi:hypothetical protein
MYSLYIDDIRTPKTPAPKGKWVVARTLLETLKIVSTKGFPKHLSIDSDLGCNENALSLIQKLVEADLNYHNQTKNHLFPKDLSFEVHCKSGPLSDLIESVMKTRLGTIRR